MNPEPWLSLVVNPDRLWSRVQRNADGCWPWTGRLEANGYGKVSIEGSVRLAHRVVYHLLTDDLNPALVLDHLCRNRACVNPDHLRQVTQKENVLAPGSQSLPALNAAKSTCPKGHPLTPRASSRRCRVCDQARDKARAPRLRAQPARG